MKHHKKVRYKLMARRWARRLLTLATVVVIAVFVIAATAGTGVTAVDNTARDIVAGAQSAVSDDPLNQNEIERAVRQFVNQERTDRGLPRLVKNDRIKAAARHHSDDMAMKGYFAHTSPSGEDVEDRFRQFGVGCNGGAENIALTLADSDLRTEGGDVVDYNGNETAIAKGLVRQWMNSPGHRDIILTPRLRATGVGVAVTDSENGTEVIATQNFC